MNLFGIVEAKYYSSQFADSPGNALNSIDKYGESELPRVTSLKEGTAGFKSYRDCSLRETERCLFLAMSYYRRGLDLMIPAASSWAQVTLYYSSFFAARALLGMFGCWISNSGNLAVDAKLSAPGFQELEVHRGKLSTYNGSHVRFWDLFYATVHSLSPWLDSSLKISLEPVGGQVDWLCRSRNEVNYNSFEACHLSASFQSSFNASRFPESLPGSLNTQFVIAEGLVSIASKYAAEFGLATDALNALQPKNSRKAKLRQLIFRVRPPRLQRKAKWESLQV